MKPEFPVSLGISEDWKYWVRKQCCISEQKLPPSCGPLLFNVRVLSTVTALLPSLPASLLRVLAVFVDPKDS